MFFSIVLRKPVWNLYDCNFADVTSTHAVNVSARLLWMDFTVCSMIHNSQHQVHDRHEQQLPNSWNLYISVHAFQLHTTLCSLACTVYVYRRVCHTWMTSDMWTKQFNEVTMGCLVLADRHITCKCSKSESFDTLNDLLGFRVQKLWSKPIKIFDQLAK